MNFIQNDDEMNYYGMIYDTLADRPGVARAKIRIYVLKNFDYSALGQCVALTLPS